MSQGARSLLKPTKVDDPKSDEEFQTASEGTLQHSRSSSYNTASECERTYSPWWEYGKNDMHEDISKEKMVLAVGKPELPPATSVLKPSPEVPPGKIVHEVTETTHLKVQHVHSMDVKSFVLTSETVRDKKNESVPKLEEIMKQTTVTKQEISTPLRDDVGEDLNRRLKEVGKAF
ncbi:hypothetical protein Trydic_g878 [Trypoxylus dichotomus]